MKVQPAKRPSLLETCGLEGLDFQVDSYIGCEHNCYYCYALNSSETDWRHSIFIHDEMENRLINELKSVIFSDSSKRVYLGYNTDPYQPIEEEYRLTRKVLELLLDMDCSASILTKSNLFLRDIDLLSQMKHASVSISAAFLDDSVRTLLEYKTINTNVRIDALQEARASGIRTTALLCPVIPWITDVVPLLEKLIPVTDKIWVYGLSIQDKKGQNWKNMESILGTHFAAQCETITDAVFNRDHEYWHTLRKELNQVALDSKHDISIHI